MCISARSNILLPLNLNHSILLCYVAKGWGMGQHWNLMMICTMQVRVIRGQGLPGCGQSTPALHAVVLDVGRQKFTTRPYRWLGCPVWEEYTEFTISSVSCTMLYWGIMMCA
jgi:hypothetical protein